MNRKIFIQLFLITLLAAILRLWQLGHVPSSPDWDEASLGYNAYSLLHTGRDEYGNFLPVVLRSFEDYKPALYAYLAVSAIALFDLTVFAIRLPSALLGIATVVITFFLVYELTKKESIALVSSLLLAISPWHIQFSRVAFEANIGLACIVFGVFCFLKGLKKPMLLSLAACFFALSIYAYQSEKVFTPLLVFALVIIYRKELLRISKRYLISAVIIGIFILFPMVFYLITNKQAFSRAQGVSIFSQPQYYIQKSSRELSDDEQRGDAIGLVLDNRRIVFAKQILANYISHFSLNWLFLTGDIERHHAPNMGLLYFIEVPFLFMGIYLLAFGNLDKKTKQIIFAWLLIAPVPASITSGVPHAVRTMNFLPTFQIFTAIGVLWFVKKLSSIKIGKICLVISFFILLFNFFYYLDQYFVQQNYYYPYYWQYGYKQAVIQTKQLENNYDEVIVSNAKYLDQSYIFFLFYMKYDPSVYIKNPDRKLADVTKTHNFDKFVFRPIDWEHDRKKHTLFVGNPDEFPASLSNGKILSIITDPMSDKVIEIVGT